MPASHVCWNQLLKSEFITDQATALKKKKSQSSGLFVSLAFGINLLLLISFFSELLWSPFLLPNPPYLFWDLSFSGPLNMAFPWLSSLIFKNIFPFGFTQFIPVGDAQIHISMPSSSLVIQLPDWHFHQVTHPHLTLQHTELRMHLLPSWSPWRWFPLLIPNKALVSSSISMPMPFSQTLALSFPTFRMFFLWLLSLNSHCDHHSPNPSHFMFDHANSLPNTVICTGCPYFVIYPLSMLSHF